MKQTSMKNVAKNDPTTEKNFREMASWVGGTPPPAPLTGFGRASVCEILDLLIGFIGFRESKWVDN